MKENEMVRQHNQLNGHESEQIPRDSGRQRSLVPYSPWAAKSQDMIEVSEYAHVRIKAVILML